MEKINIWMVNDEFIWCNKHKSQQASVQNLCKGMEYQQWDQDCFDVGCNLSHPWTLRHQICLHYEKKEFSVFMKEMARMTK